MTDRQTDKENGMTIRLTVCERDAIRVKTWRKNVIGKRSSNTTE